MNNFILKIITLCFFILNSYSSSNPLIIKTQANEEIFVFGDIHGNFNYAKSLLKLTGAFDEKELNKLKVKHIHNYLEKKEPIPLKWKKNNITIIQIGDIFDRGASDVEVMILFNYLKDQANLNFEQNKNRFLIAIGNHELLVAEGVFHYQNKNQSILKVVKTREQINYKLQISGDYAKIFGNNNTAFIVNDMIFAHGGISQYWVDKILHVKKFRQDPILISGDNNSLNALDLYNKLISNYLIDSVLLDTPIKLSQDDKLKIIFDDLQVGPTWYRGYAGKNTETNEICKKLDMVLNFFNVKKMLVAHTSMKSGLMTSNCSGKIVFTDTGKWLTGKDAVILKVKNNNNEEPMKNKNTCQDFNDWYDLFTLTKKNNIIPTYKPCFEEM